MAFLAAEAFDFAHRHALDTHGAEGILHFFQLERFDDGFNFLHGNSFWLCDCSFPELVMRLESQGTPGPDRAFLKHAYARAKPMPAFWMTLIFF
jgi:hypothetical protein